jgi:excisionase family DNA binding protein
MKKKIIVDELSWEELDTRFHEMEQRMFKAFKSELSRKQKVEEVYLERKEVCELLKIDLGTLRNWTKKGKLQKYKIGNRVYYKLSQLDKALIKIN